VVVSLTPECFQLDPSPRATPRNADRTAGHDADCHGATNGTGLAASSLTLRPSSCRGCAAGGAIWAPGRHPTGAPGHFRRSSHDPIN